MAQDRIQPARTRRTAGRTASTSTRIGDTRWRWPGRHLRARSRDVRDQGRLGARSRPAVPGLRLLVAPRPRHDDHQRVGHAEDGRGRRQSRAAARRQICGNALHVWDLHTRRHAAEARARPRASDGARAAARARSDGSLRLRRRRHQPQGSVGVGLGVAPRRSGSGWRIRKVIEIPAEPADADDAAAAARRASARCRRS